MADYSYLTNLFNNANQNKQQGNALFMSALKNTSTTPTSNTMTSTPMFAGNSANAFSNSLTPLGPTRADFDKYKASQTPVKSNTTQKAPVNKPVVKSNTATLGSLTNTYNAGGVNSQYYTNPYSNSNAGITPIPATNNPAGNTANPQNNFATMAIPNDYFSGMKSMVDNSQNNMNQDRQNFLDQQNKLYQQNNDYSTGASEQYRQYLESTGASKNLSALQDSNVQLANLNSQLQNAQAQARSGGAFGSVIDANVARNANLIGSQIQGVSSLAQAYQGNLSSALDYANKATTGLWSPKLQAIQNAQNFQQNNMSLYSQDQQAMITQAQEYYNALGKQYDNAYQDQQKARDLLINSIYQNPNMSASERAMLSQMAQDPTMSTSKFLSSPLAKYLRPEGYYTSIQAQGAYENGSGGANSSSDDSYVRGGASGENGAYQFMPDTWKNYAGKVLGDPNAQMTPQNQDKVAIGMARIFTEQGLSPKQIASVWNSGSPDWVGKKGVNSKGIPYDVPTYVEKFAKTLSSLGEPTPENIARALKKNETGSTSLASESASKDSSSSSIDPTYTRNPNNPNDYKLASMSMSKPQEFSRYAQSYKWVDENVRNPVEGSIGKRVLDFNSSVPKLSMLVDAGLKVKEDGTPQLVQDWTNRLNTALNNSDQNAFQTMLGVDAGDLARAMGLGSSVEAMQKVRESIGGKTDAKSFITGIYNMLHGNIMTMQKEYYTKGSNNYVDRAFLDKNFQDTGVEELYNRVEELYNKVK